MGILNANPDSFWAPSRVGNGQGLSVQDRARLMVEDGADCLDIGGESSRPGAHYIDEKSELERILPVLRAVRKAVDVPVSIDTRKANVARICLEEGADIINDISALQDDPEMAGVAVRHECPVILMHMKGTPATMQQDPGYTDCYREVEEFLVSRIRYAREAGLTKLAIDPGLGFGKRQEDNITLMGRLSDFSALGVPVLVGASRKGFIGQCLGKEIDGTFVPRPVDDRLSGSLAVTAWAMMNGAALIRVHDVRETSDVVRMISSMQSGESDV